MQSTIALKSRGYTSSGAIASALAALTAADAALASSIAAVLPSQSGNSGKFLTTDGTSASWATAGGATGANPSGTIGLTAVNGSASTFMRSDGAPALSQAITPTMTAAWIFSAAGAASTPAMRFTGAPFAGTGTTSFPLLYLNRTGATASTTLSTSGTFIGINTGGAEDFCNFMVNGANKLKIANDGTVTVGGGSSISTFSVVAGNNGFYGTHYQVLNGGPMTINQQNTAVAQNHVSIAAATFTQSSGSFVACRIAPTYNQTSTAAATDFLINRTQTAVGSGNQYLADFQVASASKWRISNVAVEFMANTSEPSTPTGGGVRWVESGVMKYKGSSGTVTVIGAA